MGTDIHAYVATRSINGEFESVKVYDKYGHLQSIFNGRDYEMFDALQDAIGERSIDSAPDDIKAEAKFWDEAGAYGFSWIDMSELNEMVRNKKDYPKEVEGWYGPHRGLKLLRNAARTFVNLWFGNEDDARIYFWFDC